MTTILEQKRADLIQVLREYDAALAGERSGVRVALDALGADTVCTIPPPPAAKPRATRRATATAKAAKKPTKRPATRKATGRKLAAPLAAHEPAKRIGKLSSSVKVKAAEDEADRKRIVDDLLRHGYERAALGARLAPGLYDVIRRDGGIVVTWWPKEEA